MASERKVSGLIIGNTFGDLTIVDTAPDSNGHKRYKCACSCGNDAVVGGEFLQNGIGRHCGFGKLAPVNNGGTRVEL